MEEFNKLRETIDSLEKKLSSSNELFLSERAKEILQYINGHSTVRNFPEVEKVSLQWVGSVIDLLEEIKLNHI